MLLDISTSQDKSNLLDQIFQFIGTKPEEAVSSMILYVCVGCHFSARAGICI